MRKGQKMPIELKKHLSDMHKSHKFLEISRKNLGEKLNGMKKEKNPFYGKKHTPENLEIMRIKKTGKKYPPEINKKKGSPGSRNGNFGKGLKGPLNGRWAGGKSFEPYPLDWTRTLRISIRERDMYTCQVCGEKQNDRAHDVHHIDYNKNNCNPDNLITLCKKCHSKTNHSRDYWVDYFNKKKIYG